MSTDTKTSNLIINKLSKTQYEAIVNPSTTELYLTPDTSITKDDVISELTTTDKTIVGAINELDAKPSVSSFADITGEPTDNTKLASALNAKSQVTIRRWS